MWHCKLEHLSLSACPKFLAGHYFGFACKYKLRLANELAYFDAELILVVKLLRHLKCQYVLLLMQLLYKHLIHHWRCDNRLFNFLYCREGNKFHSICSIKWEKLWYILYFIMYNVHTSIVRTWISQWFLAKKYSYFSKIISQKLIIASLLIIKGILNPFSATFHV